MSTGTEPPAQHAGRIFVGRDRELDALRAALADASSGHGRLVLLVGEPGIGKTRMTEEFGIYARSQQAQVLAGRCHHGEGVSAYWPLVQAIRSYIRQREPAALREEMGPGAPDIAQIVWEVRERLSDLPQPPPLEAAQARFRLFDSIATFLTNAASHRPVVLIVDDLHWADIPSLLLLQFLVRETREARLLVIGCYREEEVDRHHLLGEIFVDLARLPHCQRIFLSGLSEEDIERYIELAAGERSPRSLAAKLHRETEGNPLFVGEIVRLLVAKGPLADLEEMSSSLLLPPGVRETIGSRLRELSEECNRILRIASVIGQEFGLNALEGVTELTFDRLIAALAEAADARIIGEVPHVLGRYRLAHPLIREALYADLPIDDRLRLHRRVGETLEQLYKDNPEPHLAELAHHFFQAAPGGQPEKAIDYARRAAEHSLALLGYEEAVSHYERALQALDLTEPANQKTRCTLLLSLGDAQGKTGEIHKARQSFQMAAEIARKLGEPKQLARAAFGSGNVWIEFGIVEEDLIGLLTEALDGLGEGDSALRAQLMARLALAFMHSDSREDAAALIREAVEMARRVGDPAALAYTATARHFTGGPDDIEHRLAAASELVSMVDVAKSGLVVEARFWRIHALLEIGDRPAVDAEFSVLAREVEELKQPRYLYMVGLLRSMRALLEGHFDAAEQLANETLTLGQRWSPGVAAQAFGTHIFVLRAQQGRFEELEESFKALGEQYPELRGYRAALAYIYSQRGLTEAARAEFERLAVNDFADLPRDLLWLSTFGALSEVCVFLGDERRAATLYRLLLPYAQRIVVTGPGGPVHGSVSHWLGMLARTMSRWDEAVRHFEDAHSSQVRLGARPRVAHTQYELAVLLAVRGNPGDRDRALDLLAQAREVAEKLRMASLRVKVTALEHELGNTDSRETRTRGDTYDSSEAAGTGVETPSQQGGEPSARSALFRREGDYWTIAYEEAVLRLKDSVGLRYLAELLNNPGKEVLATDLVATVRGNLTEPSRQSSCFIDRQERESGSLNVRGETGGAVLDPQARTAYRRRLEELRDELEEARGFNDFERAGKVQEEMDLLSSELRKGVGLSGRGRKNASQVERARLSVTRAIRTAVRNIGKNSRSLGSYLDTTIKTGTFCSYAPDPRPMIDWKF